MPVHDWTLVEAGIFHDFHTVWIGEIRTALNVGLLPQGYYALAEQHAGETIADILTLHTGASADSPSSFPAASGGTAVAESPPRVRRRQTVGEGNSIKPRTLAVHHVSGHQLIALIEIVSPSNKNRVSHLNEFAKKAVSALDADIHLLVIDLFPPGRCDPEGMHGAILHQLNASADPYDLPPAEPLTLAAYAAGPKIEAYLEHAAVGVNLPEMPLFLRPDHYVNVPLEQTYQAAYRGVPAFWRDLLEGRRSPEA